MRSRINTTISLEAINPVANPLLHKSITGFITNMRNTTAVSQVDAFELAAKELVKTIKFHTGILVEFKVIQDASTAYTMATMAPLFTTNHPLVFGGQESAVNIKAYSGMVKQIKASPNKVLRGWVDRATGKVSGVFSEMETRIYVGTSVLESSDITPEWFSAQLLHELGHTHTYFESLTLNATTAWAIKSALDVINNVRDKEELIITMEGISDLLGLPDAERLQLLKSEAKQEAVSLLIIDHFASRAKSELGTSLADRNGTEFLADQFVVRHGAAIPFAQLYQFLERSRGNASFYSTHRFMMVECAKAVATILGTVGTAGLYVIGGYIYGLTVVADELNTTYDKPEARLQRVYNDLVQALKTVNDNDLRRRMLNDVKFVGEVLATAKDRSTLFVKIAQIFSPTLRKLNQQKTLQSELEALFNNPMYVRQAQLAELSALK